jgi:hypothetical protein
MSADSIRCPICQSAAIYVGTQDALRVYVCEQQHLTRASVAAEQMDSRASPVERVPVLARAFSALAVAARGQRWPARIDFDRMHEYDIKSIERPSAHGLQFGVEGNEIVWRFFGVLIAFDDGVGGEGFSLVTPEELRREQDSIEDHRELHESRRRRRRGLV